MSRPQDISLPDSPIAPKRTESPRPVPLDVDADADADDPFAQIGMANEPDAGHEDIPAEEAETAEVHSEEAPPVLGAIFGEETDVDDGDVFAQLGSAAEPEDDTSAQHVSAAAAEVDGGLDNAAEAPAAEPESTAQPGVTVSVDTLLGGQDSGADVFEQLAGGDDSFDLGKADPVDHDHSAALQDESAPQTQAINLPQEHSADVFAQLAGGDESFDLRPAESTAHDDLAAQPENTTEQSQLSKPLAESDFSDLLAEFDDILEDEPVQPAPAPSTGPAAPAALFDDADGTSAFDASALMQQDQPQISPPASNHSPTPAVTDLDASFVSNGSDWLADTTMATDDGDEPITFEVPQGWYDDAGEWHWYTAEEKEQVRQTMLADSAWQQPAPVPVSKAGLSTPLYSPGLMGQSENAARRTPQLESASRLSSTSSYDPYAPSQPTTATSYGTTSSAYSFSPSPYAPAAPAQPQPSPYAPQPAYDPYAPSSSSGPKLPYGLPAEPYAYNAKSAPSTLRAAPKEARPAEPKRVASNAYDPPFLRPQKSFVRPASAAPVPFTSQASTPYDTTATSPPGSQPPLPAYPAIAQNVLAPATPAKPAPPPSGPRRAKTPSAPSFAPPPEPAPAIPTPQHDAYAPRPSQDPYAPAATIPSPPSQPTASIAPPSAPPAVPPAARPPVRNVSYNAFDPPLRPTSAARARPVAAIPPVRASTPPVAALAPPPQTAPSGPPRGPSRGSVRKPSPMFESRPPAPAMPSEHRSPSRSEPRGVSPLVAPAEIPSRPASRAADPYMAPPVPPVLGDFEEDDPEGGMQDQTVWSPQQPTQAPRPPSVSYEPSSASQDVQRDDYSSSRVPTHTEPGNRTHPREPSFDSGALNRPDSYSKPAPQASTSSYDPSPYQPASSYQPSGHEPTRSDSYGLGLDTSGSPVSHSRPIENPYGPQATPSLQSVRPIASPSAPTQQLGSRPRDNSYDPYGPSSSTSTYAQTGSNDLYQPPTAPQVPSSYDPYAPTSQSSLLTPGDNQLRPAAPSSHGSDFGISPPQPSYFQAMTASQDTTYVPQQVLEQKPIAEDPLGRSTLAARNAPIAVFGFGGVLVTGFPGRAESDNSLGHHRTPSYGYASGRGQLWIRTVSDLASTSALKPNDNVFPGPLVLDPSTPKGTVGEKKKKESVIAYLEARAEEIEKGLPYLKSSASQAKREEEGKLVLVRILLAMVVGDGKLSGKPEVEDALRIALGNASAGVNGAGGINFSSSINPMAQTQGSSARTDPARLKDLSDFLSRGEKREAVQYATRHGFWAHALVISSSVDPDLWAETVSRFAEAELQANPDLASLTASYAVFSGKIAASVDDLIQAARLSADNSNDQWREVIASVVFNGKPADLACLDELGARFRKAGLNYASHACHILAPSSPFADITPGAFDRTISLVQNARDEDAIVFAEIAEYARSLVQLPKGQDLSFTGLPQLLPYKLQRAWLAAELGDVDQAKRYCTAVETASKPGKNQPQILSPALLSSLEDLMERLTGTPSANPARLIGGRKAKAGLGSWIEGRLTKFIAGEEDASAPAKPAPAAANDSGAPIGPFSHFSTISPAASGGPSRNLSTNDFEGNGYDRTSSSSSLYDVDYSAQPAAQASYSSWSGGQENEPAADDDTPTGNDDEAEFINPMAALSLGARGTAPSDYQPPASSSHNRVEPEDDDEDMGFGNTSLSRGRTPRPAASEAVADKKGKDKDNSPAPAEETKPEATADKPKAKGWLGGWFGKKDGESGGVVRAKLGEESKMVYDNDLKRWVVKGAKPEAALPAAPPPPPRAQTASPSQASRPDAGGPRPSSAAPPPATLPRGRAPPPGMPRSSTAPTGLDEGPDGGFRRAKSSLADSITADEISGTATPTPAGLSGPPPPGPPGGGPPKPPSRPGTASIDDLLSRPPSKRPGSSAKKPMRNRYVDVLTPTGGG